MKVVLVVDDDPHNREILVRLLSDMRLGVVTATCGDEAMTVLASRPVDLVFTDLRMAPGTGIELLRRLRRRDPVGSSVAPRVVVMTALLDGGESYLRALGAAQVFLKPLELDAVEECVRRLLQLG